MINFENVIGYKEEKLELERICDILVNAEKYEKLGVQPPKGLLIHGDPGVGKTLMATTFIRATGRSVFTCRKNLPNGEFVNTIRRTFELAKESAPSIVFLDDMDKFANGDERHRNSEEYVTVQSCIDEVKYDDVFVVATANDLLACPNSLFRAGRFDKVMFIRNPKGKDAVDIIQHYLSKKKAVGDIDVNEIASILNGESCAQLESVINEAGIIAGFKQKEKIEMEDMIKACLRVIFKAPEKMREVDFTDAERIAYHEAGHVVVAEVLEPQSVSLVSICNNTGEAEGITVYKQAQNYFKHKKYMETRVMCTLAGKAATEIKYGETDVGANSDLHRAFDIVERFIDNYCTYGFDSWEQNGRSSEGLRSRREMRIFTEVEKFYIDVRKLLVDNREFLDKLAAKLVEKTTLTSKEIQEIKTSCVVVKGI